MPNGGAIEMKEMMLFPNPVGRLPTINGVDVVKAVIVVDHDDLEGTVGIALTADHKAHTTAKGYYGDTVWALEALYDAEPEPAWKTIDRDLFKTTAKEAGGCTCYIHAHDGFCPCTWAEAVARIHVDGKASRPLTAAQRKHYLNEIAGCRLDDDYFTADKHRDDTDAELCKTVLQAWTEYVSQRSVKWGA